jgi:hypothetical protein
VLSAALESKSEKHPKSSESNLMQITEISAKILRDSLLASPIRDSFSDVSTCNGRKLRHKSMEHFHQIQKYLAKIFSG